MELPSFARNVANLLSFQPGVAFFGIPNSSTGVPDDRSGSVNGGRSDQSNITLDGADVNQQATRAAFSSVLRVTPDSVEEFRTTTTNGGAEPAAALARMSRWSPNRAPTKCTVRFMNTAVARKPRPTDFFNNRYGLPRPTADQSVRQRVADP